MSALSPMPGAAPLPQMVVAQAGIELRLTLRRGESLLLTLAIPVLLLVVLAQVDVVNVPSPRVAFLVPGVLALAVMSTAFTGQAIATGYERSYGVLKRLGATPLPRFGLLAGKTLAVLAVEVIQLVVLVLVGLALGWHPHGSAWWVVALVFLGTACFSGLGLLMAGTLRAEATLGAANLVWFVLLVFGGVMFPLSRLGAGAARVLQWQPLAALSDGLRGVLSNGRPVPGHDVVALLIWAVLALAAAALSFRWE
jgi:ABC-2 type transport system permease protein